MLRTLLPGPHLGAQGETPVLQYSFSSKQLSAIAGVIFNRLYFRLYPGTIRLGSDSKVIPTHSWYSVPQPRTASGHPCRAGR